MIQRQWYRRLRDLYLYWGFIREAKQGLQSSSIAMTAALCVFHKHLSWKQSDKEYNTRMTSLPQYSHQMTYDLDCWMTLLWYITGAINAHPQSTLLFHSGPLLTSLQGIKVLHTTRSTKWPLNGDATSRSITLTKKPFHISCLYHQHSSVSVTKISYPHPSLYWSYKWPPCLDTNNSMSSWS